MNFLVNPNFLLTHRNRYSEGTDDAQKIPQGHPDFNSYVKILRVFIFQTDRQMDGQAEKSIKLRPGKKKVQSSGRRLECLGVP